MREYKAVLILFITALILYAVPVALKKGTMLAQDEAVFFSTAKNLVEKVSFYIENINYEYNEKYNTNIFGIKHMNYIPHKGMVQQYPFGMSVLLAIFGVFGFGNMYYMVPFMGAVGVALFYLLNKLYFNREQALYASLLLMVMPAYLYWSIFLMADIPSDTFIILGLYLLELSLRRKKTILFVACGLALGFTICLKYANAIILPAFLFYLYIRRKELAGLKKNIYLGIISFTIPILLLFAYHSFIYKSPFITGYQAYNLKAQSMLAPSAVPTQEPASSVFSIMSMKPKFFVKHILGFPLQAAVSMPYVLFGIIALLYLFKTHKALFYLISASLLLIVLFNANIGDTWGSAVEDMTMRSSYLRYLLFGFVLLIIPAAFCIVDFNSSRLLKMSMLSILIAASIFNNFSSTVADNLRLNFKMAFPKIQEEKAKLLQTTAQRSVIFSIYADKYLLPDRAVISPKRVSLEKMINITEALLKDDIKVYYRCEGCNKQRQDFFLEAANKKIVNEDIKLYQIINIDSQRRDRFSKQDRL